MEDAPLNLKQIKALNELKKQFGFEIAVYKKEVENHQEAPLSDKETLHSLIMMECNKMIGSVIQPQYAKYVEGNILPYETFAGIIVELLVAIGMNTVQDLAEDEESEADLSHIGHELLFGYKNLNPTVVAVSFEGDTIHEYCNDMIDQEDDEEEE